MAENNSVVAAIKTFTRRAELDPGLVPYERVVYKAVLVEQGVNIDRLVHAATKDALIMVRAVARKSLP